MGEEKVFDRPVVIAGPSGTVRISSVRAAVEFLSNVDCPVQGETREQALDAALKVLDGHRSTVDARDRLIEAAKEAGVLASA
jgi:hypothetical protein